MSPQKANRESSVVSPVKSRTGTNKDTIRWPITLLEGIYNDPLLGSKLLAVIENNMAGKSDFFKEKVSELRNRYTAAGVITNPFTLANAQFREGNYEETASLYKKCLQGDLTMATPDDIRTAKMIYGDTLLRLRCYEEGLRLREVRLEKGYTPLQKPWKGEPLDKKIILIRREGDVGDTAFFTLRFLPYLNYAATKIIVEGLPNEKYLLEKASEVAWIVIAPGTYANRPYDYDCYPMSLPLYLSTNTHQIPSPLKFETIPTIPYMKVDKECQKGWTTALEDKTMSAHHIGVYWRTQTSESPIDLASLFAAFKAIRGVTFHGLQSPPHRLTRKKDYDIAKRNNLLKGLDEHDVVPDDARIAQIEDFDKTPYRDLLAFSAALEATNKGFIVTVDPTIACITGGAGIKTKLLLPKQADWRWGRHETRSAWNPSVAIYRQEEAGDWTKPLAQLKKDVEEEKWQ